MKKLTINTFLLIFITSISFSQSKTEKISTIFCEKLERINLNQNIEVLYKEAASIIKKTKRENQSLINELTTGLRKYAKGLTNLEILESINQNITFNLMKNCRVYQRITMFKNQPVPKISKLAENVGGIFTRILEEKTKTKKISNEIVEKSMFEALIKKEKELITKFGSLESDNFTKEFMKEFSAFIMTRCEPFMRWRSQLN